MVVSSSPPTSWWPTLSSALPRTASLALLGAAPYALLERLVLWPLELYESVVIQPVSFVRRHMPLLGGTLVVLMTLHGILLRLCLDMVHALFARVTYSRDPVLNFRTFWLAVRDKYAFLELRRVDWPFVHQLFGDAMQHSTSDEDLWVALHESLALCNDPALSVAQTPTSVRSSSSRRRLADAAARSLELLALARIERSHLTDATAKRIANHFSCGVLNAETSPGWRIGYLCLSSMTGFVDFPMPRVDALVPSWGSAHVLEDDESDDASAKCPTSSNSHVVVPEIYDLESMRWALEAILKSFGSLDGLVLDLRFNAGGGSLRSALAVASYFTGPKRTQAFAIDERVAGADVRRFGKRKAYYVPSASARSCRYSGPLVVLQSHVTRGTAELLCLALRNRPQTCSIGARTAGSLSATHTLQLPNCWAVEIPYQRCFSVDGELFEGVGVPPTNDNAPDAGLSHLSGNALAPGGGGGGETTSMAIGSNDDICIKKAVEHITNG